MFKKFLLVSSLLGFVFITGCASMQALDSSSVQYQQVVEFQGKTKSEIFDGALRGMAKVFNSSKAVIQYQSKEDGQIIGKGSMDVTYTIVPMTTQFTLTLEVKDGKLRATFTDMKIDMTATALNNQMQLDKFSERAKGLLTVLGNEVGKTNSDF